MALAWLVATERGASDVFVATSSDQGVSFSRPQQVNAGIDRTSGVEHRDVEVGFETPSARSPNELRMPEIRVEWTVSEGSETVRRAVRSTDAGRTFAEAKAKAQGDVSATVPWWQPSRANHGLSSVVDWREWVHVAWTTSPAHPGDRPRLSYAASSSAGSEFRQPQSIESPGSTPANPRLIIDGNATVVITWDEVDGATRRVMLRQLVPKRLGPALVLTLTRLSGAARASSPAIASMPGGVIVAWTSGGSADSTIALRRVGLDAVCTTETSLPVRTGTAVPAAVVARDGWVREPLASRTEAALFLVLENRSSERRFIVSAASDAAENVEMHAMKMTGSMMAMSRVGRIELAANGTTELKPGASHIMLFGLTKRPTAGQPITAALTLDNGTIVLVKADVRKQEPIE